MLVYELQLALMLQQVSFEAVLGAFRSLCDARARLRLRGESP